MKKSSVALALVPGLALAAAGTAQAAPAPLAAPAATAATAAAKPAPKALVADRLLLFSHDARGGTLRATGGGRYRLTLRGVTVRTRTFDRRPARGDRTVATGALVKALFAGGRSTRAAIELHGADRRRDALALRLAKPRWNARARTLSYDAQPLRQVPGSGVTPRGLAVDRALPAQFGSASLNLGSPHDGQYCSAEVMAGDEAAPQLWYQNVGYTKWSTDSWAQQPTQSSNSGDDSYMSWQSDGEDGRGCGNSVTLGYGSFPSPPSTTYTITMAMEYKIGNKENVTCTVSLTGPNMATCSVHTARHGLFDTDLYAYYTINA
ncbi:hypothetical protein Q5424_18675 [Conexibacter sp. JD483]|uniref:hypothetical protein n=1 Tax=unclassified Conexibacter TaxID=2627773 RepID=UPI002719C2F2|nr:MULTISPECIES: hypothetical protein [unclassified Conexibacter]MDO8184097.1 hypothetical protein [Conexibacter sp. CPCC 205706]MDO8197089.1 hypothetical protein [Conexibacter sp. CPCC 205762]MDR9371128.1 hypothetical protein [Conexibacter sp. JD483]